MAFETITRNRDELVVQGDLAREVTAQLAPEIRRLEQLVRQLTVAPPTPQVNVAAPNVEVSPPDVHVHADSADVNVEMPGMTELRNEVAGLRSDLAGCMRMMMQPMVRTVERDADGRIIRIIDRRG